MDRALYWSEVFAIGHPELDADHRSLIEAINAACATYEAQPGLATLRQLLDDLERSVKEHFERENKVLRDLLSRPSRNLRPAQEIGAAVLTEHIDEHQHTLVRLGSIIRPAEPSTLSASKDWCEELKTWFLNHAIKHDAHLKAVFQAM